MLEITTLLYVPANRPDRITTACLSGASGIAVDLEDAVAVEAKAAARNALPDVLRRHLRPGCVVAVRINALDTGLAEADLTALGPVLGATDLVIVPKVATADDLRSVSARLAELEGAHGVPAGRTRLLALIETARAVLHAEEIAAAGERVLTLGFGAADLSGELGIEPAPGSLALVQARSQVVLAAAAAGLPAPLDAPHLRLRDPVGLRRSAEHARALGFGGTQVIHPEQLGTVHEVFAPTPQETAWAREVQEAFDRAEAEGTASIRLADGTFVDYPVVRRARRILAASGEEAGR
ncbi:HpcH/HpaI aldolase/citrate lyase family protein [Blastococcus tunisiensis]|uniref:Citrate lyase subunit beta / citryl-CoA lyase n=1 Tax=Blastococcus tunisiensis TaxID=1798228 RepID=A0A1I1ZLP9_9ACTN|nr:CoA ester lyase [Blastococcus sp. DSM 46838]SFE32754.1 citrate lyase subunit beta / citryl-CoA lyase [Blastococcus sp. DSM 46838]